MTTDGTNCTVAQPVTPDAALPPIREALRRAPRREPAGFRSERSAGESDEDGSERWLLSYADFITLLMVLFMMLYALQLVKIKDWAPAQSPSAHAATASADSLALAAELGQLVRRGDIELTETPHGTEITINAGILFHNGDTRLLPQSRQIIQKIATTLRPGEQKILVEGHSDSVPIASSKYESNWELSSARAGAVVRSFIENGIDAPRLSALGRADTVPAALGDSAQARARNRRVTILIQH